MPSIATADQILDCAQTLLVDGGYNGFSYADIAAVVGIRKASIHHHFPAKADLVRTLVGRYRGEAVVGLAAISATVADPYDQLRAYVEYWRGCIAKAQPSYCICVMLAGELPSLPEPVAAEVRAHFRSLAAWLGAAMARGSAEGCVRLHDTVETEAEAFVATVHGAMLSARANGDPALFGTITAPLLKRLAP
ncbi:MAG TPA: TetR/AcrR family transcriptional regulator [Sphingopyxis sp.]|nr:TetR/AcrR family transcriptional regulator [Sphingopyxis sp.]